MKHFVGICANFLLSACICSVAWADPPASPKSQVPVPPVQVPLGIPQGTCITSGRCFVTNLWDGSAIVDQLIGG